jgi:RND family efflux transporter MFP subunit
MKKLTRKPLVLVLLAVFAIAGVTAVVLHAPSSNAADEKGAPKPALTVTTAKPLPARLPLLLAANGNVAAWQEASVGSEANGLRLAEVRVNIGDAVRAGQVLAVFAPDTVEADLTAARAGVLEAQANAAEAAGNASRARSLESSGALSAQQISQYLTAEQTAAARLASAKAALASQQLRLKHTHVLAPDAGVISARAATIGAVVPGGTELFRMIRQGRLEWRAEVPAADLRQLKPGVKALVKAANGSELEGRVRMIAPTVDPQSRSALVYVDLPGGAGGAAPFKAGMFASGRFALGESAALTVPQQAIAVRDGFSYVFRLNADQRVSQLKVQTGRRLAERIEVVQGLDADTPVVVSGAGFLNDGDLVRNVAAVPAVPAPVPAPPPGGTASAAAPTPAAPSPH